MVRYTWYQVLYGTTTGIINYQVYNKLLFYILIVGKINKEPTMEPHQIYSVLIYVPGG